MMILVVGIAGLLGWVVHRAHVQRDAVAAITTLRRGTRASVYYDWQYSADGGQKVAGPRLPKWMYDSLGQYDEKARPRGPKWLRDALGPDLFDTVVNVSISGDNVDDELLENLGKLAGVERVAIQGHAAPDLSTAGMARIGTLSRLKTLSVEGFTDSHGFVAGLAGKTGLRQIWLPQAAVTDEKMAIIGGFTDLISLKIDGRNVTDRGFAHVANLKELSLLEMPGVRITDLAPVADLTQLDVLFLQPSARARSANSLPDPGGPTSLEPLRRLANVTQIVLGTTQVEDRDLAVAAGLPRLTALTLGGGRITEGGLARMASAPRLLFLTLTESSVADLRPLAPRLPAMLGLDLGNAPLTDAALEPLAGAPRLGSLGLVGSKITDAGLDHLASLASLERLKLDRSAITDAGLARLKPLRALVALSLNETGLTDSSVDTLAGFPSLKDLSLARSKISAAGIERLRKLLPKAQISWSAKPG